MGVCGGGARAAAPPGAPARARRGRVEQRGLAFERAHERGRVGARHRRAREARDDGRHGAGREARGLLVVRVQLRVGLLARERREALRDGARRRRRRRPLRRRPETVGLSARRAPRAAPVAAAAAAAAAAVPRRRRRRRRRRASFFGGSDGSELAPRPRAPPPRRRASRRSAPRGESSCRRRAGRRAKGRAVAPEALVDRVAVGEQRELVPESARAREREGLSRHPREEEGGEGGSGGGRAQRAFGPRVGALVLAATTAFWRPAREPAALSVPPGIAPAESRCCATAASSVSVPSATSVSTAPRTARAAGASSPTRTPLACASLRSTRARRTETSRRASSASSSSAASRGGEGCSPRSAESAAMAASASSAPAPAAPPAAPPAGRRAGRAAQSGRRRASTAPPVVALAHGAWPAVRTKWSAPSMQRKQPFRSAGAMAPAFLACRKSAHASARARARRSAPPTVPSSQTGRRRPRPGAGGWSSGATRSTRLDQFWRNLRPMRSRRRSCAERERVRARKESARRGFRARDARNGGARAPRGPLSRALCRRSRPRRARRNRGARTARLSRRRNSPSSSSSSARRWSPRGGSQTHRVRRRRRRPSPLDACSRLASFTPAPRGAALPATVGSRARRVAMNAAHAAHAAALAGARAARGRVARRARAAPFAAPHLARRRHGLARDALEQARELVGGRAVKIQALRELRRNGTQHSQARKGRSGRARGEDFRVGPRLARLLRGVASRHPRGRSVGGAVGFAQRPGHAISPQPSHQP